MNDITIFLNLFGAQSAIGRIMKRQSTYWDVEILSKSEKSNWRITFPKKSERRLPKDTFKSVSYTCTESHPLLINYQEQWSWVSISSSPHPYPEKVIADIERLISQKTLGFRFASEYLNTVALSVLTIGYGLLITAPDSIVSSLLPYLQQESIVCSVLACKLAKYPEQSVMVLGNGYIIAPKIIVFRAET